MNAAEALAREIMRVSYIRQYYEAIGPSGKFALLMMKNSLEEACKAAGSNDAKTVLRSLADLKEIHE